MASTITYSTNQNEQKLKDDLDITLDNTIKLLNLFYVGDLFRDSLFLKDFKDKYHSLPKNSKNAKDIDFDAIVEFHYSIFGFKPERKFHNYKSFIAKASGDVVNYLTNSTKNAIHKISYQHIHHMIEAILSSEIFTEDHSGGNKQNHKHASGGFGFGTPKHQGTNKGDAVRGSGAGIGSETGHIKQDNNDGGLSGKKDHHQQQQQQHEQQQQQHQQHHVTIKSPEFTPGSSDFVKIDEDGFIEVQPRYMLIKRNKIEGNLEEDKPFVGKGSNKKKKKNNNKYGKGDGSFKPRRGGGGGGGRGNGGGGSGSGRGNGGNGGDGGSSGRDNGGDANSNKRLNTVKEWKGEEKEKDEGKVKGWKQQKRKYSSSGGLFKKEFVKKEEENEVKG